MHFASSDCSSGVSWKGQPSQDVQTKAAFPSSGVESVWRMIKETPECVLMTYQVPER